MLQVAENTAAGALVAHMTVTDLDSGSQKHVECRLDSDDDDTRSSFSLHRYQPDSDHFRFVHGNNRHVCQLHNVEYRLSTSID